MGEKIPNDERCLIVLICLMCLSSFFGLVFTLIAPGSTEIQERIKALEDTGVEGMCSYAHNLEKAILCTYLPNRQQCLSVVVNGESRQQCHELAASFRCECPISISTPTEKSVQWILYKNVSSFQNTSKTNHTGISAQIAKTDYGVDVTQECQKSTQCDRFLCAERSCCLEFAGRPLKDALCEKGKCPADSTVPFACTFEYTNETVFSLYGEHVQVLKEWNEIKANTMSIIGITGLGMAFGSLALAILLCYCSERQIARKRRKMQVQERKKPEKS